MSGVVPISASFSNRLMDAGLSPSGHLSVLAALFLVAALGAPPATAAALRISLG